ncbi:hypothetical protein PGB90_007190 [Kerria lacca]
MSIGSLSFILSILQLKFLIYIIALTLIIKFFVDKCRRNPRHVKFAETVPGPSALPIIGNSLDLYLAGKEGPDKFQRNYLKKYGTIYKIWIGPNLFIGLSDIQDLQVVFQNSKLLSKGKLFETFHKFLGDGLFSETSVQEWKGNRKRLQPYFTKDAIKRTMDDMNLEVDRFVERMKEHVNKPEFDIQKYFSTLTYSIITRSLFDYETDPKDETVHYLQHGLEKVTDTLSILMFLPFLDTKLINYFVYKYILNPIKENLRFHSKRVLEKNLPELEKHISQNTESECKVPALMSSYKIGKASGDVLGMHDEILMMLQAGTETTAVTNSFVLLMLAMYPDVQEKVHKELDEVFGDDDRSVDFNDLDRITYLDQVIKETGRRFVLTPMLFREAEEDIKLGNRVIPAGTGIIINIMNIHFNPDFYPNPYKFNPDNFSPEAIEKRPRHTYLLFSAGPRNCIGKTLAEIEIKLTIIGLLRKYTVHTNMTMEKMKFNFGFEVHSAVGYPVSFKWRNKKSTKSN